MLQRVAQLAVLSADPINPLSTEIRFWFALVERLLAGRGNLVNPALLFVGFVLGQLAVPLHLFGNNRLCLVGVTIFSQQLSVLVVARVALFQEFLVLVLVPWL